MSTLTVAEATIITNGLKKLIPTITEVEIEKYISNFQNFDEPGRGLFLKMFEIHPLVTQPEQSMAVSLKRPPGKWGH